jgi:hypothetical protein
MYGRYQQREVVIKTLLKKEDIIYTTEEQAKSVITRLFKIRDSKFIPLTGNPLLQSNLHNRNVFG